MYNKILHYYMMCVRYAFTAYDCVLIAVCVRFYVLRRVLVEDNGFDFVVVIF